MASTNKTPNYNLSQFQPTDEPQRVDWNSDMTKIDTALKTNATNIGLFSAATPITWMSSDIVWCEKPNGIYYAGSDGSSLGYPEDYLIIWHARIGTTVFQLGIGNSSNPIRKRRFNTTSDSTWRS